jgi:hypothetical protein
MAQFENTLTGWVSGPPPKRDDGGLAIVELSNSVEVDGQDHFGQPIIVSRWLGKIKTTGAANRLSYEDCVRHIDIAATPCVLQETTIANIMTAAKNGSSRWA